MEREVAELPETYRAVFILREVEGLSTLETAECLSVTEDVIKTRLHRARTMLRDNLYRSAGITLDTLFTFGNARCDRLVAAVMARIWVDVEDRQSCLSRQAGSPVSTEAAHVTIHS